MAQIKDDFDSGINPYWHVTESGRGLVATQSGYLWMTDKPTPAQMYTNAQISDYAGRRDLRWRPPLRMTVTAHAAGPVLGTAGFGFWNHPFAPGERGFRLPRAVWFFFSSPPSNMQLARGVPGPGWKAATFDAARWQFLALLPTAPLAVLLMRVPALYDRLWPIGQRAISVSERLLDTALLTEPHTYTIDWQADQVTFAVDGDTVHQAEVTVRGPLGFVTWIDNQYAVVTPQGHLSFGLLPLKHEQSLVLDEVMISSGED